jgi:5-methylthioribose kinase
MFLLTEKNMKQYLVEKKLITPHKKITVRSLQGGLANHVFLIQAKAREFVLKQTLQEPHAFGGAIANPERNYFEVKALKLIRNLDVSAGNVPSVIFEDPENYVYVMTAVPQTALLYQTELMAGNFHFDIAYALGNYTAQLHSATYGNENLQKEFYENPGYALRDLTTDTAFEKHPNYTKRFQTFFAKTRKNRLCLIDADITPKNILIHNGTFTKLDLEVIQYGDPGHDVGITIAHFFLPAIVHHEWKEGYLICASLFLKAYQKHVAFPLPKMFFENMKNYCAWMMLGRVDSLVTFPWLKGYEKNVRKIALAMFDTRFEDSKQLLSFLNKS